MISVKKTLLSRFNNLDLSQGILESLCSLNDFHKSHRWAFPYKSLNTLLHALEWPQSFHYEGDYPKHREPGWSDELNGVTNDNQNWYFTQNKDHNTPILWKFPIMHDLNDQVNGPDDPTQGIERAYVPSVLKDAGYKHFGDLDYYQGNLYMTLTYKGDESPKPPPKIVVFRASDLKYISDADLKYNDSAGWCAINPLNGLLYSSWKKDKMQVHKPELNGSDFNLIYIGEFKLFDKNGSKITLTRTQGGVFSKSNGHLYLVDDTKEGGILGFDMITGKLIIHIKIDYKPKLCFSLSFLSYPIYKECVEYEELEGITIWDQAPGIPEDKNGQLHLIMIDNDVISKDDLFFKHFSVSKDDKNKI